MKNSKNSYRELVISLHHDVRSDLRKPSEILKHLAIVYYNITVDMSRDEVSRDAATIMLKQIQAIKRNKEMYNKYINNVKKNKNEQTCLFWAEQYIYRVI